MSFPNLPAGMGWPFVDATTGEFQSAAVNAHLTATIDDVASRDRVDALAIMHSGLAARRWSPFRMVVLGSSTAYGSDVPALSSVTARLMAHLQASYPARGFEASLTTVDAGYSSLSRIPGVHVYNGAVPGATSANYLDATKVTRVGTINPTAVVHIIGSNDYAADADPATVKANLLDWIGDLDAAITKPAVHILVHAHRRGDVTTPDYPWSAYGDALRAIAIENPATVAFVDLDLAFQKVGVPSPDVLDMLSPDNVHLSVQGHDFMADELAGRIGAGVRGVEAYIAADTFNRANGSIGTADSGHAWSALSGTWTVNTNQAAQTAGGTVVIDAGAANVDITFDLKVTNNTAGIVFCADSDSDRLGVFFNASTDTVALFKSDGGGSTTLASESLALTPLDTHTFRVVHRYGVVLVYTAAGALLLAHELSSGEKTKYGAYTKIGLRCGTTDTDVRWDNFQVRAI